MIQLVAFFSQDLKFESDFGNHLVTIFNFFLKKLIKKIKKEKQNYKNSEYKIISKLHLSGALPLFFIL